MLTKKIIITNKLGLHARAALKLINLASRYQSSIMLRDPLNRQVDAKDIMAIMSLTITQGREIELVIDGDDEHEAMTAIEDLITIRKFDEE